MSAQSPAWRCRPARAEDCAPIRDLLLSSFASSREADLIDALNAAGDLAMLHVAEGDDISGVAAWCRMSIGTSRGWALAVFAVQMNRREQGIATSLVRMGIHLARMKGESWLAALGNSDLYRHLEFQAATPMGIRGTGTENEVLQILELTGPLPSGEISLPMAFELLH